MAKKQIPFILKFLRRLVITLFSFCALPVYWLIRLFPRNQKIWIFSSWFGQQFSDNSRIFFEYVNKNNSEIKAIWISRNKNLTRKLLQEGFNAIEAFSVKGIWYRLRAGKIFTTSGDEFSLFPCNGIEYYSLWHGMPLKKIMNDDTKSGGLSWQEDFRRAFSVVLVKLFPWKAFVGYNRFVTVTNSEFFVPFLQTAFSIPENKILRVGSPRCDALFDNKPEPLLQKLKEKYPGCKIILFMPTFRTSKWSGEVYNPFVSEAGFVLDDFTESLEQGNYIFIYKPHYCDLQVLKEGKNSGRFVCITDEDYHELYNFVGQVDILATDYSSIYFDFIATGKSVILMPFDYEDYLKTSRGHYFDYKTYMEGATAWNWEEFYEILKSNSYHPVSSETKTRFAEYIDGNCCEKLLTLIKN